MSEDPRFEFIEFNPRRHRRGAEGARCRVWYGPTVDETELLWMTKRDAFANLLEFGESEGLRQVLKAYETPDKAFP